MELLAGNFELTAYPGLLVKDSYWRWPERNLAGNAIEGQNGMIASVRPYSGGKGTKFEPTC